MQIGARAVRPQFQELDALETKADYWPLFGGSRSHQRRYGSLWRRTFGLSDGSLQRTGRRGLRGFYTADASCVFRYKLCRIKPAWARRKHSR